MNAYFRELLVGVKSLLVGLKVTFKAFCEPVVTVQYPREKIDVTPHIRGHIELVPDPETGASKCVVCMMCEKSCPSQCISAIAEKREGVKGKVLTHFMLDFTRCSLCGICVESCNKGAIAYSSEYELAGFSREDFHIDLIKRLEERR
ncbi:MAG: NADH-quinone oxidoreductase subunit I [Deltaproteobacteria bacterium]|nr:MAG: NADH-quinone oxidoreductase subunit I [Deltaproteobacteria bacterium]